MEENIEYYSIYTEIKKKQNKRYLMCIYKNVLSKGMNNIKFRIVVTSVGKCDECGQGGVPTSFKDITDVLFHKTGGGGRSDLLLLLKPCVGKQNFSVKSKIVNRATYDFSCIFFFGCFHNPLKIKTILSSWALQKEAIGKILSAGQSLPTSALNYLYVMLSFMYITYLSYTQKKLKRK